MPARKMVVLATAGIHTRCTFTQKKPSRSPFPNPRFFLWLCMATRSMAAGVGKVRCEDAFGHVITANPHQSLAAFKAEVLTNLRVQGLPAQYLIWQLLQKDEDGVTRRPLLALADVSSADLSKGLFVALTTVEWEDARREKEKDKEPPAATACSPCSPCSPYSPLKSKPKESPSKPKECLRAAGLPSTAFRRH